MIVVSLGARPSAFSDKYTLLALLPVKSTPKVFYREKGFVRRS